MLGEMLVAKNILPETARILQRRYSRSRLGNTRFRAATIRESVLLVSPTDNHATPSGRHYTRTSHARLHLEAWPPNRDRHSLGVYGTSSASDGKSAAEDSAVRR